MSMSQHNLNWKQSGKIRILKTDNPWPSNSRNVTTRQYLHTCTRTLSCHSETLGNKDMPSEPGKWSKLWHIHITTMNNMKQLYVYSYKTDSKSKSTRAHCTTCTNHFTHTHRPAPAGHPRCAEAAASRVALEGWGPGAKTPPGQPTQRQSLFSMEKANIKIIAKQN